MYLPRTEILIYFVVYILFLSYGIYQIYMLSEAISSKLKNTGFTSGWKFLDRKRDNLDFEWEAWKNFVWDNCLWFLFHLILTEIFRWLKKKLVSWSHVAVSVLFLIVHFNLPVLSIILFQHFTFILLMHLKRKMIIWICATTWLFLITFFKYFEQQIQIGKMLNLNEFQYYEVMIIISWNILKSISFSIDYITSDNKQTSNSFDLTNVYGYALYFPSLLLGPFMLFGRYNEMRRYTESWNTRNAKKRILTLMVGLSRACFWLFFTDFALHFVYLGNLQNNPEIVNELNPWSLYTFGYLMGQFFHNKYVVFYGLPISIAKYENINAPGLPKCIGRIHLYSKMWKYFDQGFESIKLQLSGSPKIAIWSYFEIDHVRYPFLELGKKIYLAHPFATFSFIYVWHGIYEFVFIWSVMNFICLQLEQIGRNIGRKQQKTFRKYFGEANKNRMKALFGTQIFIP
ncbi:Protein-cysteine N-palmitoyltransferase Rasp, partial [Pseudolycoriella hygida]